MIDSQRAIAKDERVAEKQKGKHHDADNIKQDSKKGGAREKVETQGEQKTDGQGYQKQLCLQMGLKK